MIRFKQFSLSRGSKQLFQNVNITLNPGEHAGLVGANGAGKSSLFGVLLGQLTGDIGDFIMPPNWRISHLAQEIHELEKSAIDHVIDGDYHLRRIEANINAATLNDDGDALALAYSEYADADGYTAKSRAEVLMSGLGFTSDTFNHSVSSFSGGWRVRLNLARALMCPSDLLLLDEPTNHLDLEAIVWLEEWLSRYSGTLIIISHDREFLDAATQVTLSVEHNQIQRYGGNYSHFEIQRAQQLDLQQNTFVKQQRNIDHLQSFIDRFRAKASKAKQVQSRVKALERMEQVLPVIAQSPFTFEFATPERAPNPLIKLDQINCGYNVDGETKTVLRNISISLQPGERIGLLAANGQGKSTFIKTLAQTLPPLQGEIVIGNGLQLGYFAQHQLETLNEKDTPLQALMRIAPNAREQTCRDFLGRFDFQKDMAVSPIAPLSGGEKSRLALALIIWQKPNLLLLDEPTNHLDLEMREAIATALAHFEGTLILVSHDRHLLRVTADVFWYIVDGQILPFEGDLDDYRLYLLKCRVENQKATNCKKSNANEKTFSSTTKKTTQSSDTKSLNKSFNKKIVTLEKQLENLTLEKDQLLMIIADPKLYEEESTTLAETYNQQLREIELKIKHTEEEWLSINQSLEQN